MVTSTSFIFTVEFIVSWHGFGKIPEKFLFLLRIFCELGIVKPRWLLLSSVLYTCILAIVVYFKIKAYHFSLSALVSIWEGFYEINPDLVDPGFVVYKQGGYDGQFFYFLAKSIFSDLTWEPIYDSYFFRMHRIFFSLVTGSISMVFGFSAYPLISLSILLLFHLVSFFCLQSLLPKEYKPYSLFYLFSAFSLNSQVLLVADSLFVSLSLIAIYFYRRDSHIISALFFLMLVFTRELGALFLFPILWNVYKTNKKIFILYSLPLVGFALFFVAGYIFPPNHLGTNPLGFFQMTDYPIFGFLKSFFDNSTFHFHLKESPKIIFFLLLALGFFFLFVQRRDFFEKSEYSFPMLGFILVITIAEEGYWRSFDNISRMFTAILPLILLQISNKNRKTVFLFCSFSFLLYIFIILRNLFITPAQEYFISI